MKRINLAELIKETDSLTYLNSLKVALTELKDELSTIDETREYQHQAIERARRIMRRIDNQYRAVVKASQGYYDSPLDNKDVIDKDIEALMEGYDE